MVKTADDILQEQRSENTKAYAKTIQGLQLQISDLEVKLKNIDATFKSTFATKFKEVNGLEEELRKNIARNEDIRIELGVNKRVVELAMFEANKILDKAKQEKEDHVASVEVHVSNTSQERNDIAQRIAACVEREKVVEFTEQRANEIIKCALEKEKELDEKIKELNIAFENMENSVKEQEALAKENQVNFQENQKQKESLNSLKSKCDEDQKGLIVMRNELDSARVSLGKRKLELDASYEDLKQKNIKLDLDVQRLQSKEKDISSQTGKLNELKNNVEALIKIKESKGA